MPCSESGILPLTHLFLIQSTLALPPPLLFPFLSFLDYVHERVAAYKEVFFFSLDGSKKHNDRLPLVSPKFRTRARVPFFGPCFRSKSPKELAHLSTPSVG